MSCVVDTKVATSRRKYAIYFCNMRMAKGSRRLRLQLRQPSRCDNAVVFELAVIVTRHFERPVEGDDPRRRPRRRRRRCRIAAEIVVIPRRTHHHAVAVVVVVAVGNLAALGVVIHEGCRHRQSTARSRLQNVSVKRWVNMPHRSAVIGGRCRRRGHRLQ